MRVIAHLSDLHFGRVDGAVLEPLRRRLVELEPHLVVVSGDLTQRARAGQFREARAFLDTLPGQPFLVPGNHDVPLWNVFARFLAPLAGYRRHIAEEVEPSFLDDEIAVVGINTARSFVFKGGRVSEAQLARVQQKLCRLRDGLVKILVMHHPLEVSARLPGCDIDILMAGHLHESRVDGAAAIVVQAGTATSSRTREEPNAFNLLRISRERVEVRHYALREGSFVPAADEAFQRAPGGWTRCAL